MYFFKSFKLLQWLKFTVEISSCWEKQTIFTLGFWQFHLLYCNKWQFKCLWHKWRKHFSMCTRLVMLQAHLATPMGLPHSTRASRKQPSQKNIMSFCCFNYINQLVEESGKNQSGASSEYLSQRQELQKVASCCFSCPKQRVSGVLYEHFSVMSIIF